MTDKVQKIRAEVEKYQKKIQESAVDYRITKEKAEAYKLCVNLLSFIDLMQEEPKECMYSKDNYTDEDRKSLCEGCEDDCEYNKKETVSEIDFKQELYKAFGHVKDFTLCLKIARCFYEMGRNHQEPVSEDLEEELSRLLKDCEIDSEYIHQDFLHIVANHFADWQKQKDSIPVSEDLGDYINELSKQFPEVSFAKLSRIAVRVAKWQKQQDQSTIELAEDHAMLAGMEKMREEMMSKAVDATVHMEAGNYPYIPQIEFYDYDKDIPLAKEGDRYKVILIKES